MLCMTRTDLCGSNPAKVTYLQACAQMVTLGWGVFVVTMMYVAAGRKKTRQPALQEQTL